MRARLAAWWVLLAAVVLALSGCSASLDTSISMDRTGRGEVTLTLKMDSGSLQALGLGDADANAVAARFMPLLADADWQPGDASGGQVVDNVLSVVPDGSGGMTLQTRKRFDNVAALKEIMNRPRDLRVAAGPTAATVFAGLKDLPATTALINQFTFSLGSGTGDNPGFSFFGRGGVGNIGQETCAGDRVQGFSRSLRDSLELSYELRVPGGPGSTNATETPRGASVWLQRYGDCLSLQASSGGGSSSTLVNGLVLAGLSGLLLIVFIARGVRRRRARKALKWTPPPADSGGSTG